MNNRYDPRVVDAVRQIQAAVGLPVDGVADEAALDVIFAPDAPRTRSWGDCITRKLTRDDRGYQVRCLEQRLAELGYPIVANGHYGARVVDAVRQIKVQAGLDANGVAGAKALDVIFDPDQRPTRSWGACITRKLTRDDRGYQVRCLEQRLAELGYPLTVNGHYGPRVVTAVRQIKVGAGLAANGVAGPKALDVIFG